jgi:helicase SWR1
MASINATKNPKKGAHRSAKKKGRIHRRRGVVTEERIATERTALLAERQTELEGVLDTHDTLVS